MNSLVDATDASPASPTQNRNVIADKRKSAPELFSPRPSMIPFLQYDKIAPPNFTAIDAVTRMPLKQHMKAKEPVAKSSVRSSSVPGNSSRGVSKDDDAELMKEDLKKVMSSYNALVREVRDSRRVWSEQQEKLRQENKRLKAHITALESYRKQHALESRESRQRSSSNSSLRNEKPFDVASWEKLREARLRSSVLTTSDVHELHRLLSKDTISDELKAYLQAVLSGRIDLSNASTIPVTEAPNMSAVTSKAPTDINHDGNPEVKDSVDREQSLINSLALKETQCHILKRERDTLRETIKVCEMIRCCFHISPRINHYSNSVLLYPLTSFPYVYLTFSISTIAEFEGGTFAYQFPPKTIGRI